MYKVKHVLTIAFLTFCATMSMTGRNNTNGLVGAEKKFAAASDELYLFKDGEWDASLGTVTYNSTSKLDEATKAWVAGGYNIGNNVQFSIPFNFGAWEKISFTLAAKGGWMGVGMMSKSTAGCFDGYRTEFQDDTGTFELKTADYKDKATTSCTWWKAEHSSSNDGSFVLDVNNVYGLYLWGSSYSVKEIKVSGKIGEAGGETKPDTELKDDFLLSSPAYSASTFDETKKIAKVVYGATQAESGNYYVVADGGTCNDESLSLKEVDGKNVIHATGVSNIRFDYAKGYDLTSAGLDQGKLKFDAKFTVKEGQKIKLRLFDGSGSWGERWASETELTLVGNNGEWNTYEIDFSVLSKIASVSTWGNHDTKLLQLDKINGIGFNSGEAFDMEINNIHFEYKNNGKAIKSLTVNTTKKEYLKGTAFDMSTVTIDATYEDDRIVKNISGYTFKAPAVLTEEDKTVTYTVNYNNSKVNGTLELNIKKATGIEIAAMPNKTTFKEGETIDLTGMKINALYGDEKVEDVAYTIDQTVAYVGLTKVVVSYAGSTVDLPITVTAYEKNFAMFNTSYTAKGEEGPVFKDGYYASNGSLVSEGENVYYKHEDTTGWKSSRFNFSDGANLNLQAVAVESLDAKIFVRYKATEGDKISLGLMNRVEGSTWDNAYTTASANIVKDGEWHIVTFLLSDFDKNYEAHLDNTTDLPTKPLNFKEINGWLLIGKANMEISDISVKWDGDLRGDFDDKAAPKLTYTGERTFNLKEGDAAPEITATAYDIIDGDVEVKQIWSEGSIDENGKMLPGDHTLILRATDKAGNATNDADYTITVHVEANTYTATTSAEHGTVTLSSTTYKAGDVVTITAAADEGYELDTLTVKDAEGNAIEVKDNKFTAPASNVTVTATFKAKEVKPNPDKTTEALTTDKTTEAKPGTTDDEGSNKKGCGGSVIAASSIIATLGLVGIGLVLKKKKSRE